MGERIESVLEFEKWVLRQQSSLVRPFQIYHSACKLDPGFAHPCRRNEEFDEEVCWTAFINVSDT
jgi:hypothetical protein